MIPQTKGCAFELPFGLSVGTHVCVPCAITVANAVPGASSFGVALKPVEALVPGDLVLNHEGDVGTIRESSTSRVENWFVELHCDEHSIRLLPTQRILAKLRPRSLGGSRDWSASPDAHRQRRRELRRDSSFAERKLWNVLRGSLTGFKFRRQHSLGPYIADFYCREAHLVVEIDGEHHYTNEGREHDRRRDGFMRELGLDIFRIPVSETDANLDGVWLAIQKQCRLRTESVDGANWVQAELLRPGDRLAVVLDNTGRMGAQPLRTVRSTWHEAMICSLKIDGSRSLVTEACVVSR